MPEGDTLFRTAAGLRPYLVGRDVQAARTQGPGPVPQVQRVVGRRIDAVEAHGKNLLIRFDGGLELRTHLRARQVRKSKHGYSCQQDDNQHMQKQPQLFGRWEVSSLKVIHQLSQERSYRVHLFVFA